MKRKYELNIFVYMYGVLQARTVFSGSHEHLVKTLTALEHQTRDKTGKVIRLQGHPFFWNQDKTVRFKLQQIGYYFDRRAHQQMTQAFEDSPFNFI